MNEETIMDDTELFTELKEITDKMKEEEMRIFNEII